MSLNTDEIGHETSLPERFWVKVDTSGDCWLWTAGKGARGDCGQFRIGGRPQYPQRLAFIDLVGSISEGHTMHRDCGTKLCVRPGAGHVTFRRRADCLEGEPLSERFWSKVNKDAEPAVPELGNCWEWTRRIGDEGYGHFSVRGENRRTHTLAYEDAYGPVGEGLCVDHKCRNRKCVRPSHLQAVTPALNSQNRSGVNRRSKTGVRGVYAHSDGHGYVAQGRKDEGGTLYLGIYKSLEEAKAVATAWRHNNYPNSIMDQLEVAA